jgi:predicted RNA-binding Zn ribbon-like protein
MKTDQIASSKPTVGGHVALDLMNTVSLRNGERVDSFHSDQAVLDWLADYALDAGHLKFAPGVLLERARALRETVRTLVVARKEGRHLDPQLLNRWLTQGESHLELAQIASQGLRLERRRVIATVEQLLAPVAEAAADLLTLEDFSVIRKCESPDCVLWFYDRTKGHKRRWCSMAGCGNRHKVSSFRKRQNG